MKTIKFYKDNTGWYADIAEHTKAENRMVFGADKFLEYMDKNTDNDGFVTVECDDKKFDEHAFGLKRVLHEPWGAFYSLFGPVAKQYSLEGFKLYLCNVVHTVFKKHPKNIYIKSIK